MVFSKARALENTGLADETSVLNFLYYRRVTAAARLLAHLPADARQMNDTELVREAMSRASSWDRKDLAIQLAEIGEAGDPPALVEAAQVVGQEDCRRLISFAIRLAGLDFARSLTSDLNPAVARTAMSILAADTTTTTDDLQSCLHSPDAETRMIALREIISRTGRDHLEGVLSRYKASHGYFYNVVARLDRHLYAPRSVSEHLV